MTLMCLACSTLNFSEEDIFAGRDFSGRNFCDLVFNCGNVNISALRKFLTTNSTPMGDELT